MSAPLESPTRRAVLLATAGAAAGASPALAPAAIAGNYGAPVIQLCVPAGLTLEKKAAMVKGMTDVVLKALGRTADPARRCFVAIVETAEGGFGVDGRVFTPRK
jgi:phenylpyruvate tautomerase PptA (4-oxalocrotonate tautomerase family)